jgi:hypothetical protein
VKTTLLLRRILSAAAASAACFAQSGEPAVLTEANFVEVGDSVADMLDTSGLAFSTLVIGALEQETVGARRAIFHPPAVPEFTEPFESPCPDGGSVRGSLRDADGSGDLSTRDRVVTVFASCAIDGRVISGRSEFTVTSHRFERSTEITELDFRFKDLGSAELRWNGAARVQLRSDLLRGTEHYVVTYQDLAVTRGRHSMRWNFSLEMLRPPIGNQVASVNGAMTVDALALRIRQDEPFTIAPDGLPRSGQLTAVDPRGARLQVEATRRRYDYRWFAPANRGERPDATSHSKAYGKG